MATFEEIEAETGEALDVTSARFARLSIGEMRAAIRKHLEARIYNGRELDKRALDLLGAVLELEGCLYTDGELLDLAAIVLEAWQEIEL